jgi:hypothetical protein
VHEPYYRTPVDILNAVQKALSINRPGEMPVPEQIP